MNTTDKTLYAYNRRAREFEQKFSGYQIYLSQIDDFERRLKPESWILDLGCGPGINSKRFMERGHNITGVDFSESMIRLARKNCPAGDFIQASATEFVLDKKFDALCLSFIIVHLRSDETRLLLSRIGDLCTPGALVYLSFMSGKESGFEQTSFSENEIYFNYYNPDTIISIMKEENFELISYKTEGYLESDNSVTDDNFLIFQFKGTNNVL